MPCKGNRRLPSPVNQIKRYSDDPSSGDAVRGISKSISMCRKLSRSRVEAMSWTATRMPIGRRRPPALS
jgi:hypothetical protein